MLIASLFFYELVVKCLKFNWSVNYQATSLIVIFFPVPLLIFKKYHFLALCNGVFSKNEEITLVKV